MSVARNFGFAWVANPSGEERGFTPSGNGRGLQQAWFANPAGEERGFSHQVQEDQRRIAVDDQRDRKRYTLRGKSKDHGHQGTQGAAAGKAERTHQSEVQFRSLEVAVRRHGHQCLPRRGRHAVKGDSVRPRIATQGRAVRTSVHTADSTSKSQTSEAREYIDNSAIKQQQAAGPGSTCLPPGSPSPQNNTPALEPVSATETEPLESSSSRSSSTTGTAPAEIRIHTCGAETMNQQVAICISGSPFEISGHRHEEQRPGIRCYEQHRQTKRTERARFKHIKTPPRLLHVHQPVSASHPRLEHHYFHPAAPQLMATASPDPENF